MMSDDYRFVELQQQFGDVVDKVNVEQEMNFLFFFFLLLLLLYTLSLFFSSMTAHFRCMHAPDVEESDDEDNLLVKNDYIN